MIIISLREGDGGMIATVNAVDTTGAEPKTFDVSKDYTVRELLVTLDDGTAEAGWFVAKKCSEGINVEYSGGE